MNNIGLSVEFDGKKNVVMIDGFVKEYPIGGMACEYARFRPTDLKEIIMACPHFQEGDLPGKLSEATMWFYYELRSKYGVVVATMVLTDFANSLSEINLAKEEELHDLFANEMCHKDIRDFILQDSGYDTFGRNTIGQALLSAYGFYSGSYAVFKHTFNMLASEQEYEEKQVNGFWSMYGENVDFQHFDFSIMLYENVFHSIFIIKSSLSLILFEAAHAMDAGTKFIKCKNCGKYFVPIGRSDALYCGYPSPQDPSRNCRDIGPQATRTKKMKSDAATQEYRRLYMRLKMAMKRHPENEQLQYSLGKLTGEMKEWRKKQIAGEATADDILVWINSIDDSI